MNIARLLERIARQDPRRAALFKGSQLLHDYGSLQDRVARLAGLLVAQGLRPGDRLGLCLPNSPLYFQALWAALWAGLVVVPINFKLHPREVDFIVADAGIKLLLSSSPGASRQENVGRGPVRLDIAALPVGMAAMEPVAAADREPDELAWLFYTSGTTGKPKGVMLTHRNLAAMTLCYQSDVDHVEAADAVVYAAPLSHGAGLYTFAYVSAGARHVIPESGGFDSAELVELAAAHDRVCLFAAPTMVRRLVDQVARDGSGGAGFKTIVYGGGPMYVADIRRALAVMGPRFVQIYGQGESPMTISVLTRSVLADAEHPDWLARLASVGVRQSVVDLRVVDDHDAAVAAGTIGEVIVRGDVVMAGYWNNPDATAATLRGGWLHTGDVGTLDAQGFLTLKDRSKDLIISGGSNVYPREVEEVLLQHPRVLEAAVIGAPDAEWGEIVIAFVVLAPAGAEDAGDPFAELDALCLDRIARFKRPKRYLTMETLPKNNYGKVLKTELRTLV